MTPKFATLGLRSDALVMTGLSVVTDHGAYLSLRTPDEPDYWYGNVIAFKAPPVDPVAEMAVFARHFPESHHVQVTWDVPGVPLEPIQQALERLEYVVGSVDVLALTGAIKRRPVPAGITLRHVQSAADWDQVLALQLVDRTQDGHTLDSDILYLRGRNAARCGQIADGLGAWFGAFDGDRLVAQMGIFVADGIARYQRVETHPDYRKRGIASALLVAAYDWAMAKDPAATVVIQADNESAGGRLYRSMGFEVVEVLAEAGRYPE